MTTPIIAPDAEVERYGLFNARRKEASIPQRLGQSFGSLLVLILGLTALLTSSSEVRRGAPEEKAPEHAEKSEDQEGERVYGTPIDFSHRKHVPDSWLFPQDEVKRDCRGCHDFSAESSQDWPAATEACASCHGFGSFDFRGTPKADPAVTFDYHKEHNNQNCSMCHVLNDELELIPKYMPVPVQTASYCNDCHMNKGVPIEDMGKFNEALTAKFRTREEERGDTRPRFLHKKHLSAEQLTDGRSCQRCHTRIAKSDSRNLGEKQFDPKSCSECHTAGFEVESYTRPSKTAAAFWHEYHLGSKAMRIEEKLSEQMCVACHEFDEDLENYRLNDKFPANRDSHDGCVTCHEHQDWRVEKHGQTDECAQCHAIEGGSLTDRGSMATNRPRKLVLRPRPVGFLFGPHSHAMITAMPGEPLEQECAECHRAVVPELPSMLSSRPFDHNSHLSGDLSDITASKCQECHSGIEGESLARLEDRAAEAHHPDAELSMIYREERCEKCHGGKFETAFPENRLREVMWFSHNEHLNREHPETKKTFDCLHCHVEPDGGDGFSVRIPEKIQNCTECHNHGEFSDSTAGVKLEEVGSCVKCHRNSPIPERGVPVQVERLRVAGKTGIETHDRGGVCTDCHQVSPPGDRQLKADPTSRSVTAVRNFVIHQNEFPEWDPKNRFFNRDEENDQWCVDCHWQSQTAQFAKDSEFKYEWYYEDYLSATALREKVGDKLEGFPGFAE